MIDMTYLDKEIEVDYRNNIQYMNQLTFWIHKIREISCTEYNINRKIIRQHYHAFFIIPYSIGKIEDEYSYNDIND